MQKDHSINLFLSKYLLANDFTWLPNISSLLFYYQSFTESRICILLVPCSLGKCNVCIVDLPTEFILLSVSLCLGSFIQVYNVIDPTSSVYFDLQPRGHVTQCYCCLGPSDEIRPVVSG